MVTRCRFLVVFFGGLIFGCGDSSPSGTTTSSSPPEEKFYALRVHVALVADAQGVAIGAQNGAIVRVAPSDIVGKNLVWATTTGGENIFNVLPMENGKTPMSENLTADFQSSARYGNGPWEMAAFVSIAGASPFDGPQPGDLAAFDNTPPPAGQPPVTGVSVRMTVEDGDAEITLGNQQFVEY